MSRITKRLEKQRVIHADDLLAEVELLDAYPHRYVFVMGYREGWAGLFRAVEVLEGRGWEIVSWTIDYTNGCGAVARRLL
ncbi:hypothetical protein [Actinomadura sp. 6N118]|uniref:hypothetical protein n=1 Tax=Actinomadura sp. 6N118 TaxID=3375151 RepID=UPI0037982BE8